MRASRLILLTVLLSLAFCGLGARLVFLQVLRHEELHAKARRQSELRVLHSSPRGEIRGSKNGVLATTKTTMKVCADPGLVGEFQVPVADALAPLLGIKKEKAKRKLVEQLELKPLVRNGEVVTRDNGEIAMDRFVVLKDEVSRRTWHRIQETMKHLKAPPRVKNDAALTESFNRMRRQAIFAKEQYARSYPHGSLASHVLGFVRRKTHRTEWGIMSTLVGVNGLERRFNSFLNGINGWRQTAAYPTQGEQVSFREHDISAKPGLNVITTIDLVLQELLEKELKKERESGPDESVPNSISGIMIRPDTGKILAMATLPSFDPNSPGKASPSERRNRILTDTVEPGSTFKIVSIAGALNEGLVTLNDRFDCEDGVFYHAGHSLEDHGDGYGILSVREIITKSSNIGTAKVALRLGEEGLYDYVRRFGFGETTGIPLAGEAPGKIRPVEDWSELSITRIPMGHEVAVTRLQMTMAICAIANGGRLMRPMLVDRIEDANKEVVAKYQPQMRRRVISPKAAEQMTQALETVVSSEGTAERANLDRYQVAGKTGTAEKVGFDQDGNFRYLHNKHFASFIGFLPADDPELCIAVMLDEPGRPYYGGWTAAPVFKRIAKRAARYLNIPPDYPSEDDASLASTAD